MFIRESVMLLILTPSGHYLYRHVNTDNSAFCPHSVVKCFVQFLLQTVIIFLRHINWLIFVMNANRSP